MSKSLFLQLNITLVQNNWRINNFVGSGKRILNFLNFTHREKLPFLFSLSYFSFSRNKQLLENKKEKNDLVSFTVFGPTSKMAHGPQPRACSASRSPRPGHNLGLGRESGLTPSLTWAESGPINRHRWIRSDGCSWFSGEQKRRPAPLS